MVFPVLMVFVLWLAATGSRPGRDFEAMEQRRKRAARLFAPGCHPGRGGAGVGGVTSIGEPLAHRLAGRWHQGAQGGGPGRTYAPAEHGPTAADRPGATSRTAGARVRHRSVDLGAGDGGDQGRDRGRLPPGARVEAAARQAGLEPSAAGPPSRRTRRAGDRRLGGHRLASHKRGPVGVERGSSSRTNRGSRSSHR
jgi:hypothetical protein